MVFWRQSGWFWLNVSVGAVREGAGVVDAAPTTASETGIAATIEKASVTKARAAGERAVVKTPETAAETVESVMEATEANAAEAAEAAV